MRITGMHSVLCHAARGRYVVTDSGCTTVPDTASESHGLVPCVVAVAGAYSASRRVCFRLVRWLASSRVGGIGSAARRLKRGGKRAEQQCGVVVSDGGGVYAPTRFRASGLQNWIASRRSQPMGMCITAACVGDNTCSVALAAKEQQCKRQHVRALRRASAMGVKLRRAPRQSMYLQVSPCIDPWLDMGQIQWLL